MEEPIFRHLDFMGSLEQALKMLMFMVTVFGRAIVLDVKINLSCLGPCLLPGFFYFFLFSASLEQDFFFFFLA